MYHIQLSFLEFRRHICWEYFLANLKLHIFLQKNYSKRMNNFYKIAETKCYMCTWNFPVYHESQMYHIHRSCVFWLFCKVTKMYICIRLYWAILDIPSYRMSVLCMTKVWISACYFAKFLWKFRVRKQKSVDFERQCEFFVEICMKRRFFVQKTWKSRTIFYHKKSGNPTSSMGEGKIFLEQPIIVSVCVT